MHTRSQQGIYKAKQCFKSSIDCNVTEPLSVGVASQYPQWCIAMDEEFQSLQQQQTWTLVPPPQDKNIVGPKWVFKLKRHSDGTIGRYKAWLVARGYRHQQGIDLMEPLS